MPSGFSGLVSTGTGVTIGTLVTRRVGDEAPQAVRLTSTASNIVLRISRYMMSLRTVHAPTHTAWLHSDQRFALPGHAYRCRLPTLATSTMLYTSVQRCAWRSMISDQSGVAMCRGRDNPRTSPASAMWSVEAPLCRHGARATLGQARSVQPRWPRWHSRVSKE